MTNIKLVTQEKYNDPTRFEKVAEGIYKALYTYPDSLVQTGEYITTLSFTLEEKLNETVDRQYPLEDILDKFLAHVSEFVQDDPGNPVMILELCTQGWPNEMEALLGIVGKHVYNREVVRDGKTLIELVIE